ncbi:MAG: hypothetical protein ACFFDI_21415 [Promethearchaeota archaeon]
MNLFTFAEQREQKKKRLGRLEAMVRHVFDFFPHLIELKHQNELIKKMWFWHGDGIPAGSILRIARKLRASGEYDTEQNIKDRSNLETAHHDYFRP